MSSADVPPINFTIASFWNLYKAFSWDTELFLDGSKNSIGLLTLSMDSIQPGRAKEMLEFFREKWFLLRKMVSLKLNVQIPMLFQTKHPGKTRGKKILQASKIWFGERVFREKKDDSNDSFMAGSLGVAESPKMFFK